MLMNPSWYITRGNHSSAIIMGQWPAMSGRNIVGTAVEAFAMELTGLEASCLALLAFCATNELC